MAGRIFGRHQAGFERGLFLAEQAGGRGEQRFTQIGGFVEAAETIEDAVRDLCAAFRAGKLPNSMEDDRYFNVRRLKRIQAK